MAQAIGEPVRETPVVAEADVVVCGGGPGGVSAPIAASHNSAPGWMASMRGRR